MKWLYNLKSKAQKIKATTEKIDGRFFGEKGRFFGENYHKVTCRDYLTARGFNLQQVGEGTYRVNPCPFCNHNDCFTVFEETDSWFCFSEQKGGSLRELKRAFGEEGNIETQSIQRLDFTDLIDELHLFISRTSYFKERGLRDTVEKYKLGYIPDGLNFLIGKVPNIRTPKSKQEEEFYRCYKYVLPLWDSDKRCRYFILRRDDKESLDFKLKYGKDVPKTYNLPGFPARIFNDRYLNHSSVDQIFIVEGIFDALSLEEGGFYAIALNSVSNFYKFLEACKQNANNLKDTQFVLIPDNDDAGYRLVRLFEREFPFFFKVIKLPDYKDCNEYLIKKGELRDTINDLLEKREGFFWISDYLKDFFENLKQSNIIPTSFNKLDETLNGGLRPGLTVLGGLTSLGKTSFALQMVKNILEAGSQVFYFALEEARFDLMAKLLSNILYESDFKVSTIDVLLGRYKLKESGGIEYTADVILGLQGPQSDKVDKKKNTGEIIKELFKNEPVYLQLRVLKNRYGKAHVDIDLQFFPRYGVFKEVIG